MFYSVKKRCFCFSFVSVQFDFLSCRKILVYLVFSLGLNGCIQVKEPSDLLNPEKIFPEDLNSSIDYDAYWDDHTRPGEYAQFYMYEYCAVNPDAKKSSSFNCLSDGPNNQEDIARYIRQGIVLSDSVCERWFDLLIETQANTQFTKDNFAIAGSGTVTIMGAVEAAAKEIAVVGALFSGINAGFENFEAAFLFTPDMHIIEEKIEEVRDIAAAHLRGQGKKGKAGQPKFYEDAKERLVAYHNICSGAEIKRLIEESVVQRKFDFDPDGINWILKTKDVASLEELKARAEQQDEEKKLKKFEEVKDIIINQQQTDKEIEQAKALIEQFKAEIEKAKAKAEEEKKDKAKAEAEKAKSEADKARSEEEAAKAMAELEKAKLAKQEDSAKELEELRLELEALKQQLNNHSGN